jgi:D-glycero-D-manno-heptose 1,7-bisphosphate phosphatase
LPVREGRRITTAFLDRDGTINRKAPEGDYIKSWSEFEFLPGAVDAIRMLSEHGIRTIVVTNQRGIALGRMTEADLEDIHARMVATLEGAGAALDAIYHCPHDYGECDCRKPDVGMFSSAQRDFPDISFEQAVVIGDSASDMEAATRVGSCGIRIGAGGVTSLHDAVERLLGRSTGR